MIGDFYVELNGWEITYSPTFLPLLEQKEKPLLLRIAV